MLNRNLLTVVMAFLLLPSATAQAAVPRCLSAVDDLIVEYDIPVAKNIPGAQIARPSTRPPRQRPDGRRPTSRAPAEEGTSAHPDLDHHGLSSAQRTRMQNALFRARIADARGEEAQCMDFLHQAQAIAKQSR